MVPRAFLLICALQIWTVHAQFQFFDQMFGGHRQQQQQQQQQQPSGGQWAAYSESIPCSDYLCSDTLSCVQKPVDCPCPNVQDVKCVVPDEDEDDAGTVVCVRGATDCAQVGKLTKKFAPSGGKRSK